MQEGAHAACVYGVNDVCNGVFVRERGDLRKGPKNCLKTGVPTGEGETRAGTVLPAVEKLLNTLIAAGEMGQPGPLVGNTQEHSPKHTAASGPHLPQLLFSERFLQTPETP